MFLYGMLTKTPSEEETKLDETKTEIVIGIRDALYTPADDTGGTPKPAEGEADADVDGTNEGDDAHDALDNDKHNTRLNNADPADDSVEPAAVSAEAETYEVTAYTSGYESTGKSPGDPAYGVTASGAYVTEGRTVACPPELAFNTTVHIEGVGERVCEDRGSAITSGHLDVYMPSLEAAQAFGRQALEVRIINEE